MYYINILFISITFLWECSGFFFVSWVNCIYSEEWKISWQNTILSEIILNLWKAKERKKEYIIQIFFYSKHFDSFLMYITLKIHSRLQKVNYMYYGPLGFKTSSWQAQYKNYTNIMEEKKKKTNANINHDAYRYNRFIFFM